jgi:hypothetical protein
MGKPEARAVAIASLLFTYAFFFGYLPPFRWVHVPYDLDGFHLPLLESAFQSLRQGRFPLWDSTIYCGLSLVGKIQAGLFYPPTRNRPRSRVGMARFRPSACPPENIESGSSTSLAPWRRERWSRR